MAKPDKPATHRKWTGEQALAFLLGDAYVRPEQIQQAVSQAPPGALLAAAIQRLLDPATRIVSHALCRVLTCLPWTDDQFDAVEQAWQTVPDHARPKAVCFLQLLLATGKPQALALAHRLTRSEARAVAASSSFWWDLRIGGRDVVYANRIEQIRETCGDIADRAPDPVALPLAPVGQFRYYSVSIQLRDAAYKASRRFLIAHDADWDDLHHAIQKASDAWDNSHLWSFSQAKGRRQIATNADDDDGLATSDTPIAERVEAGERSFNYVYDFGDYWRVSVTIGAKAVLLPGDFERVLLAGTGAFPPEDCGGAGGLYRLTLAARARAEAAAASGELPGEADEVDEADDGDWGDGNEGWDPEAFDFEDVKEAFDRLRTTPNPLGRIS